MVTKKRAKAKQHTRTTKTGKVVVVNKGVSKKTTKPKTSSKNSPDVNKKIAKVDKLLKGLDGVNERYEESSEKLRSFFGSGGIIKAKY